MLFIGVGQPPVVPLRSTILVSPTLLIGSRRARLLTSSAALRSPQTCLRLPHCLGNRHTCRLASQPPSRGTLLPSAACGFPRPPALRDADYRCQPDADLPPVRFPNPCRLRRHPLSGEFPASRPVAPVIVLPLWIVMILLVEIGVLDETNRRASACVVISV